jgi:benzoyl-CoA reductase/2-hydroxyglutaryl-CoA dehydratase subunit BcrC/BadD/HgdB
MTGKKNIIKEMSDRYGSIRDHIAQKYPDQRWRYDCITDYYQRLYKAGKTGEQVVWVNFATIPEIFWAMDLIPASMDGVSGMAASSPEGASDLIDLAEQYLPNYLCASNKISTGAVLAGAMPVPSMLVHPSAPCDAALIAYPQMAEYFGIPLFCIDVPYVRDERCYDYLTNELKRLIAFLEEHTKRKLDPDKLRQVMEYSNQAHGYKQKVNQLLRSVPCPIRSVDIMLDFNAVNTLAGTPELIDYLKTRYEITRGMVEKGTGNLGKENFRLVWVYAMPVFDWGIYAWLEGKYGAVSISALNIFDIDPTEDISDTDKILRALAHKVTSVPMLRECGGPWEYYLERLLGLCRQYGADAAVFGGHIACKHTWAIAKLLKDRLYDELGIPTLTIEMDVFDPRVASLDVIKAKFDDFFEMLTQR